MSIYKQMIAMAALGFALAIAVIYGREAGAQGDPHNVGPRRYGDFNVTGGVSLGNPALGSGKLRVEQSGTTLADGITFYRPSAAGTSGRLWIDGSDAMHITRGTTDALSVSSGGDVTIEDTNGGGNVPHACQKKISAVQNSAGATVAVCDANEIFGGGGCFISSGSANLVSTLPSTLTTWTCAFSASVTWTAQAICCVY